MKKNKKEDFDNESGEFSSSVFTKINGKTDSIAKAMIDITQN